MKLFKLHLLLGLLFLFLTVSAHAQKLEVVLKEVKNYSIIPVRAGVLITYQKKGNITKGMQEVMLDLYDADLNKQKTTDFQIDKGLVFLKHTRDSDNIYFLYTRPKSYGGTGKTPPILGGFFRRYTIVKYNLKTAVIDQFPGSLKQTLQLFDFKAINGVVYMGGAAGITDARQFAYIVASIPLMFAPTMLLGRPYKPSVVSVNTNEMDAGPNQLYDKYFGSGYNNITAFGVNEYDNEYNALITTHSGDERGLVYKNLKEKSKTKTVKINGVQDKKIYNVKMQTDDTRHIYSGIYGTSSEIFDKPYTSQGIVVGMINNSKSVFNHYFPYSKFKSIKFTLSDQEEKKMQREEKKTKKMSKKKSKKLKGTNVLLTVLMHDALLLDDKIIYMGELCQPHIHIEMVAMGVSNGGITMVPMGIKDGDKRVGILVFAVDLKGNLLWEKSVPIRDGTNAAEWEPKVKFSKYQDSLIRVSYQDEATIKTVLFNEDSIPEVEEILSYTSARVADTINYKQSKLKDFISGPEEELYFESTVEHWYDNSFIEYGEQVIPGKASKAIELRKKRRVLYLQKINTN